MGLLKVAPASSQPPNDSVSYHEGTGSFSFPSGMRTGSRRKPSGEESFGATIPDTRPLPEDLVI